MRKNERIQRLFRVIGDFDEASIGASYGWHRDLYSALGSGSRRSVMRASRMILDHCRRACKMVIQDPLHPYAGHFQKPDGSPDFQAHLNDLIFSLFLFLSWRFRYFKHLSPKSRRSLDEAIRVYAIAQARRDVHLGYTNMVCLEIANRILAGEILGDVEMSAAGFRKLKAWLEFTALAGGPSEFNSPTYTGVVMHAFAALITWTKIPAVRLTASIALERMWLHLAAHYHKPTAQIAGPHSRAYHLDITFNPSIAKSVLYAEIGDKRLMGPNHTPHDCTWSLHRLQFFLPSHVRPILTEKQYPYQSRETVSVWTSEGPSSEPPGASLHARRDIEVDYDKAVVGASRKVFSSLDRIRVQADTTCYQTGVYSLGTVSHWDCNPQRNNLFATWRKRGRDKWDFFRYLFERVFLDGERIKQPWLQKPFYSVQDKGTAVVSYRFFPDPAPFVKRAIRSLEVELRLPHPALLDEARVDTHKLALADYPWSVGNHWCFFRDGEVYIGVRPLRIRGLGRSVLASLKCHGTAEGFNIRTENQDGKDPHCLAMSIQLYSGRSRCFQAKELARARCGYVLEISSRQEAGSFNAFCERLQGGIVEEKDTRRCWRISYRGKRKEMALEVPYEDKDSVPRRWVNGREILPVQLESPTAVQDRRAILRIGRNILRKKRIPLWFVADEQRCRYVVTNQCAAATPVELKTPHGAVHVEKLGLGRLKCSFGARPRILVESLEDPGRITWQCRRRPVIKVSLSAAK